MSFEGYYQVMCKNGHYDSFDLHCNEPEDWECHCKEKCAWWNIVNQTNGSYEQINGKDLRIDGYVDVELISRESCPTCNTVLSEIYKIPEKGHHVT